MTNTTDFNLNLSLFGIAIAMDCSSVGLEGTVENHASGSGTFSQSGEDTHFTLDECTVVQPSGCAVANPIKFVSFKGEATEFEGKPAVKLSPTEGETLTTFTLYNCGILNGGHNFSGYFRGVVDRSDLSLDFTSSSSSLAMAGYKATLQGTARMKNPEPANEERGELLTVAP